MPEHRSGTSPAAGHEPLRSVHGDVGRRRSAGIHGTIVASAVLAAGAFGVMMILLKLVVTH